MQRFISHPFATRRTKQGFTLIELLVVIAIIAILASILFPAFAKAREAARRSSCSSNMKQVGLGVMQYTQEYDERYPIAFSDSAAAITANLESWDSLISPYLGVKVKYGDPSSLLVCPSDSGARISGATARTYSMATGPYTSYTIGSYDGGFAGPYGDAGGGTLFRTGRAMSQISSPSSTLMVVENPASSTTTFNGNNIFGKAQKSVCQSPAEQLAASSGNALHLETYNYLFIDGHVKAMRPAQTIGAGTLAAPAGMWTIIDTD